MKKMMSLRMMAIVAATMMTLMSFAKTKDVSGRVIDEQGQSLPFVNVVLMSLPDSTFIQGAVTDDQGVFHLVCKLEKAGLLKVSCIGYETQYISLSGDSEGTVIRLKEDAQLLGEVTVKGQDAERRRRDRCI